MKKLICRSLLPLILLIFTAVPAYAQAPGPSIDSAAAQTAPNRPDQAAFTGCDRVDVPAVNAAYEQEVVELVNQQRWDNGQLPPLRHNPLLDLAARFHAKDMYDENYFEHDSYDGSNMVCTWDTRISHWYQSNNSLGENIARGFASPESVMEAWMGSTGHRENILSPYHHEIGVGYYTGQVWVQDFGTNTTVYPLVINREAAETGTTQVSLYVYGSAYEFPNMRFKNDGQDWSGWMPFSSNATWVLRPAEGLRTVSVELQRANGTTVSSSDDINLDASNILGGVPDQLTFIFDQASHQWIAPAVSVQPTNLGGGGALTWRIAAPCSWITLNTLTGVSPSATLQVSVSVDTSRPGRYDDTLTILVDAPLGTLDAPKTIAVHVRVVPNFSPKVFFPLAVR